MIQILIVFAAVLLRLLPHEPNVAPIGALALFGGVYFKGWRAFAVPILAMIISDSFLGMHGTILWVYGSFLLITLMGIKIRQGVSGRKIAVVSVAGSIAFFLITNFGVWFSGTMYPKTLAGFGECFLLAMPFFRNTLVGDLGYNLIFFGSYYLARNRFFLPLFIRK